MPTWLPRIGSSERRARLDRSALPLWHDPLANCGDVDRRGTGEPGESVVAESLGFGLLNLDYRPARRRGRRGRRTRASWSILAMAVPTAMACALTDPFHRRAGTELRPFTPPSRLTYRRLYHEIHADFAHATPRRDRDCMCGWGRLHGPGINPMAWNRNGRCPSS